MLNIKRILNKKTWTGKELGILYLNNVATQYAQTKRGETVKPLVEGIQLQRMVATIKDGQEALTFSRYVGIHTWLNTYFNMAQTQLMQAQLAFKILENAVRDAILTEDFYRYVEQQPAIMTKKQLEDTKKAGIENYLRPGGKDRLASIFLLLVLATDYFFKQLREHPNKPNPLKAIKKKYATEPVRSKYILTNWNTITGKGYYLLDNGKRSDKMTEQQFRDAVDEAYNKHIEQALAAVSETSSTKGKVKSLLDKDVYIPIKWHAINTPARGLNKWQVLETASLFEIYGHGLKGTGSRLVNSYNVLMTDLKKEFSDLVAAMFKEIEAYVSFNKPLFEVPVNKWGAGFIPMQELYQADFFGVKHLAETNYLRMEKNEKALYNGLALIEQPPNCYLDENGYYAEQDIHADLTDYSLEGFFTDAKDFAVNTENAERSREVLLNSYYFLLGYNYTLDRIATIHEAGDITAFKMDTDFIEGRIDALNALIPVLFRRIRDFTYQEKELRLKKLQVLNDYFLPINYRKEAITAANKKEISELVASFKAFSELDHKGSYLQLLLRRPTRS